MSYEDELQSVLERVNQQAATAQKRAVIFTLFPILVGIALIVVTWQQVGTATEELNNTEAKLVNAQEALSVSEEQNAELQEELTQTTLTLDTLQIQVRDLQSQSAKLNEEIKKNQEELLRLQAERDNLIEQVSDLSAQVEESGVLRNKFFEGDILVILKDMSGDFPSQTEMLQEILSQQETGSNWLAGGIGPFEFDSPGFAAYLLTQQGLLNGNPEDLHYTLLNTLPNIDAPENGDLVFYRGGYTMFYFQDPFTQENFVIGMTTFGIVAMKYDFAERIGIGDVQYP
ncbi:MAG: C40 family peptidase [Anaerolineae bacterium]|nr:C40 family peptidase [Anaerolineae bacterium]